MTRAMSRGLLSILVLVAIGGALRAAEPSQPQPYVVLVGIDKYADPQILPRKHAETDVKALYDLLTDKGTLGVDAQHIRLLLGSPDAKRNSQPATRANILDALNWVGSKARRDDPVIFAFVGEGAPLPLGERACYFASDSTFKNRNKDAVAAGDIEGAMEKLKSNRFVAFLDVNFKGFDSGKEKAPDPNLLNFYREYMGKDEEKAPAVSRVVFLANTGIKPSLDLEKHGVFMQALLAGLKGKADTDGYEPDGLITVTELTKYVENEVHTLAQTNGKTEEQKSQHAVVLQGQTHDFVVTNNATAMPKVKERLAAFDKLARDLPANEVEEGHNLLARMPKLEEQQNLRKAYQKLADGSLAVADFQGARTAILDRTKLSQKDANFYGRMIIRATQVVQEGFVKKVEQGQMVDWAVRGLYKRIDEALPSNIKERLDQAKTMREADLQKLAADARLHLGKREDLANGKDITFSLHPMLANLDRHTDYYDQDMLTRLQQDIQGNFSGIGVQIRQSPSRDFLQVVTPIKGSPAYKAKMYAGDLITTIIREVNSEGEPLPEPETISTKGMTTEDAVKKILGRPGTKIKLLVEREGEKKPIEFNLLRGRVEVESVVGVKRNADDGWDYVIDPENHICYVRLTTFSRNTQRDLSQAVKKLQKAGIKGFILDLRFNPGGLLDSAVKISDMFIDDGVIVTIRPRHGPETSYIGKSDGSYLTFPMVCLVNGYSASGSEIVAACLQDHGRAIIMGTRSYGKGSVQTIHPFETGGQLKLTTATYWRPSNKNINKASTQGREEDEWGVLPDKGFVLKLPTKELYDLQDHLKDAEVIRRPGQPPPDAGKAEFRDRQLQMALDYLRGQIRMAAQAETGKKAG
jgi:carboxyl-terminal processing protease